MTFQGSGDIQGGRIRTGSGGGTGMKIAGGGIGAIIIGLIAMLLTGNAGMLTSALTSGGGEDTSAASSSDGYIGACTVEQANSDPTCRLNATVQSLDAYWAPIVEKATGQKYVAPDVLSYSGQASTPCGTASNATGPFYCPPDQTIYIDVSFNEVLKDQFGGSDGALAQEYVVAHEYGHHIEQVTGMMDAANRQGSGANSDSVKIELAADCFAGMWAGTVSSIPDPNTGQPMKITQQDFNDAMTNAAAVGDDHIMSMSGGRVNPDSFTHGTSAQREKWFSTGFNKGTLQTCNTLQARSL
ncbi:MAG: neutral zinc metallopeptidase [Cellulomonadaceae bacterium]|jgi:predicted metalloprotease|nr:neutral zinc metallopeptidase [Cellulomonadaceae bacterium]